METFEGIYENGVVRFPGPVALPEHTPVIVAAQVTAESQPSIGCNSPELYALLSEQFDSGDRYAAERHNEHQP